MIDNISARLTKIEQEGRYSAAAAPPQTDTVSIKRLEAQLERLEEEVGERDRVLEVYRQLMAALRTKIMEKY